MRIYILKNLIFNHSRDAAAVAVICRWGHSRLPAVWVVARMQYVFISAFIPPPLSSEHNVSEHCVQIPPIATRRVSLNYKCTAIRA